MVILDECHKIKNPNSLQAKGLLTIVPKCKIAMSGTPVINSPVDMYSYLKWLGFEKHTYSKFSSYYKDKSGNLRNIDKLDTSISKVMLRRTKELLDLPEKIYKDEFVELSSKQEKLYQDIQKGLIEELNDNITDVSNVLAKTIRLRQVTGCPALISDYTDIPPKFIRAKEIIEECIDNNESIIVFSEWKEVLKKFFIYIKESGIPIFNALGDDKAQIAEDFQNYKNPAVLIGTVLGIGTGLTLTKANNVVFLDEPWTNANKEQAIDRCHRIGSKNTVVIHTIMCTNTIDEKVHVLVEYKKNIADAIIDRDRQARFLLGLENDFI